MDFDSLMWVLGAFWVGALLGFVACAIMQAGRRSEARRARPARPISFSSELSPDTVTRY